jgi:hypothetical protein
VAKKKQTVIKINGTELILDGVVRYKTGKKAGKVKGLVFTPASMGAKGGTARAKNLTKEQLSKIGKAGAAKRWASKPHQKGGK